MCKYIRIGMQVYEKFDITAKGFKARPVDIDPFPLIPTLDPSCTVREILTPKQKAERRREKKKYGSTSK